MPEQLGDSTTGNSSFLGSRFEAQPTMSCASYNHSVHTAAVPINHWPPALKAAEVILIVECRCTLPGRGGRSRVQ